MANYRTALNDPLFKIISKASEVLELKTYVIGGYVRDYILQRGKKADIDIVTVGNGIELAKQVSSLLPGKPKVQVFKTYGTAMLRSGNVEVEFVGARKESYTKDSRNPQIESGTLQDDQNRRDFTINALALSLNDASFGELLDPFNGTSDLDAKILRTPLDPDITYSDDPLRMMRAIRFATQLDFKIEKASFEITALKGIDEQEGQTHKDNFYHTLEVVDNIARNTENVWLRWAALLHDIGKAPTKKFSKKVGWTFHGHEFVGSKMVYKLFKRLRMPLNDKMKFVQKMVLMSSRPIVIATESVTDSAVRRLVFDAGDYIEDLMTLCEADITTKNPKRFKKYHNNFKIVRNKIKEVEERDHIRNFQPPVSGDEIIKTFNLKPGREIGIIKEAIKEAILEGEIPNEYDAAYDFMLTKGKELGL